MAKPAWWDDEDLKALSKRVLRAAPNEQASHSMRAVVLCGMDQAWEACPRSGAEVMEQAWEAGPRSAAELKEAATHFERSAELSTAPAVKAGLLQNAAECRNAVQEATRAK